MVDKKKDNESEFEDDAFEADEFDDASYQDDDSDITVLDDAGNDDIVDDEFDEAAWDEGADEETGKAGKKNKKAQNNYTGGEKKSPLNFNNIVIAGGVVVGVVVLLVMMGGSAPQQGGAPSNMFQSIMNISGVMDRTIYGDDAKTPTAEELNVAQQQSDSEGFLNNPEAALPPTDAPPQPNPIAPAEDQASADEPMLEAPVITADGAAPRGPDGVDAVSVKENDDTAALLPLDASVPEEVAPAIDMLPPSETKDVDVSSENPAEELLKQAIADRNAAAPVVAETATLEAAPSPITEEPKTLETPKEVPAPEIVSTPVSASPVPVVSNIDANALSNLESKLDTLLKRMDKIESDIGSVRDSNSEDYGQIAQNVAALRSDVDRMKKSPTPQSSAQPTQRKEQRVQQSNKLVKKETQKSPAPLVKRADPVATIAQGTENKWVLRAAQPGRAWVSLQGERDMQSVEVGQTLAGIGKISAIIFESGRWTITGSQGRITQ